MQHQRALGIFGRQAELDSRKGALHDHLSERQILGHYKIYRHRFCIHKSLRAVSLQETIITNAGFKSIEAFVEYVALNYNRIIEGKKNSLGTGTHMLQLQNQHNNTLYI